MLVRGAGLWAVFRGASGQDLLVPLGVIRWEDEVWLRSFARLFALTTWASLNNTAAKQEEVYVYHSDIRKRCCAETLPTSNQIYSWFHSLHPAVQSCSFLWAHLFNTLNKELSSFLKAGALQLYGEEVSERNKRERRNEQLVWRGGTAPRRRGGEGAPWKRPGAISHPSCQRL